MAHGGVAVARHEGRVIFVPDVIPGERVRARIVDDRKKAAKRADGKFQTEIAEKVFDDYTDAYAKECGATG